MPRRRRERAGRKTDTGPRIAGDLSDPHGFAALLVAFLDRSRTLGFAEATIKNRRDAVNYFTDWCAERDITRPNEVTRPILERYQRHVAHHHRLTDGKPLSLRGQINRLSPLKIFFAWLSKQHYLLYNPAAELELPRGERRLPKHVLNRLEVEQVINQCDIEEPIGIRDRAILETLYSTGMRRMELINLQRHDLDYERGTVVIRQGKHRKDRLIPIGDRALAWIDKYLIEVRPDHAMEPDHQHIFITTAGDPLSGNRLSELVKRRVDAANLGKEGSCHLIRHSMATLMLENGADIRYIQAILGHEDLSTTQLYTQIAINKLKAIHTQTHPARWTRE